jgi:hypothetical protein
MKKIYSFLMALSIVLCANANSFEAAKSLEISMARPQVSKKVNVTPSQVATPVINKTIQVKKQALNAQQQERMAIARQAQSAPAVKVNGVRQIEAAQTATKQALPTNAALKAPAKATAATDTVEIVATKWVWTYYESDNDWYTTLIDGTGTYEIKLDYVSDTQAGTFTEADCIMDYTGMYIYDAEGNRTIVTFTEVDIVVTDDENGLALNAELLGENNTLYLVSALKAPLPEPVGYADLAYTNATLEDGTRSSETFQFWADENGVYTSFLIASDEVVGEYTQDDMYVAYANYIMFVDGTDTTFVDFLGFDMAITKEGQTYNLVADVLGSDTIMYHITMSYTKPAPTDTIDIVATNMTVEEFEFYGMVFCTVSASNDEYKVTLDMANGLPMGELTNDDFNAEYSSVYRIADATEIVFDEVIAATVTEVDGQRAIVAQALGVDNVIYNMDLSYVVPETTDTVNVVFDELAEVEYYASYGDYYLFNQNDNFIVTLDIFEEEGNLMGEYTAEDFDLYYTQLGVIEAGDTTVVTIAEAKAVVTATEEEGIVLIEAELVGMDAVLYKVSTKADVSAKGLEYDATEGFLVDSYTTDDIYTINDQSANGYIMFDVEAADGSDLMGLVFWVDGADENTIIPTGTYQINGTGEAGTVLASTGMGAQGLTYSLYATMDEEGYIVPPCWFMTGGEVVVTEEDGVLKIAVDAVNSNNLIIYVTCEYDLSALQASLPNDATAADGAVERNYGKEDQIWVGNFAKDWGMVYVDIAPADESEWLGLGFVYNEFEGEIIPEGTYEINASGEVGTVAASQGIVDDFITESYFAAGDEEGNLVAPFYFLVSGTVVVEHVDGQMKVTVDAVNSNGIPVHITYDPTATSGNDKTPLQYDATEGAVDRSYTTEEITINKGTGYFQVLAQAADGTDMTGLLFIAQEDENTIIPVGTYEINATEAEGTVLASEGVSGNSITLSFYGETNPQGQIYVPCWFMVEGTVVVTAADGKLNIEVNALNSNDVPVHIVMEYDLNTKQGLQYDMTEGSLNVVYTDNDVVEVNTDYVAEDGVIYLNIDAADGSNTISVAFFAEAADPVIGIPAGTYPINDEQDYGTVMSSPGVQGGYIYPSFYGNMNAQGQITIPCYFMVGGQVVVENIENHLKVTIDALNSYDVPAHIVYEADPVGSAVENVTVDTTNASKVIENNQLFIMKEGVMYNVLGSVVK